jgi:hypothetical protein
LVLLYRELGDHDKGDGFLKALHNMIDLSNNDYDDQKKDIGIGHKDMVTDMVKDDVKYLRDIHCVGASTVKLIEEWIETGTMERLEDLRKEATPSITERVRYMLNGEEFEAKHDYNPDFLEALGELAELCAKENDFRATSFRRAIIALEEQIITAVEDIKLFKLAGLKGVGRATLELYNEFIVTGKIKRLEDKKKDYTFKSFWKLADTDVRKAIAQLPEDIKLTVDGEGKLLLDDGNRDQYIGRGCPFTFEFWGDTYEVYGKSDTKDYGGIPQGLEFEGTLTKNGKQSIEISMEDDQEKDGDIVEHNVRTGGDFEKLGFHLDSDNEKAFIDTLNEELEENVVNAYDWPTGHE